MNLAQYLVDNARRLPDRAAVCFGEESLTWRELDRQTDNLAAALQALGVRPGDRVSIMLPNSIAFLVSYWAAIKAGGVASPAWSPGPPPRCWSSATRTISAPCTTPPAPPAGPRA